MDVIATKSRRSNTLLLIASSARERHLLKRAMAGGNMVVEIVETSRDSTPTYAVAVRFAVNESDPLHESGTKAIDINDDLP